MRILVILRMMPDPASELELNEDGLTLDREWLDFKLNDFDDQALEEAILLKEATGAEVTAVGVGEGSRRTLQMALARGADRAIEVETDPDAMICSRTIAKGIVKIIRDENADLVLTGVQTPEDLYGQLAPYLAAFLDWPSLSGTSHAALSGNSLSVAQERGGGRTANYEIALPAVLGVQTASKAPRYVSGSKLREAAKTPIESAEIEAPPLAPSGQLVELAAPQSNGGGISLGSTADEAAARLIDILATEA
ncbi:electron transfer flavoprotein subunit beta/FixA family protein [Oricola indica]|jgi:electron transfer flavoprotein beta subunit|uniref:electron transfer flavoprotein subunit beta/FixA family protein n=1 Tax=Oricola indica TaxID=2872591 RepID=UPI001CBB3DB5|nr:hypothetical protein [Oricola indica]